MTGKRLESNQPEKRAAKASGTGGTRTGGKEPKKQKKARTKKQTAYRVMIASLAVLLALVIGVVAWWKTFVEKPELPDINEEDTVGEVSDIGQPVRTSGDRKKDFYTFLVIGRDTGGGGNTDTVLLVAYDVPSQKLNVMSIPRDTMVNVSWDVKKINSVYNMYGGGDKGIDALGKEVAQLVGFVPDFQVVLEWKAVGELVDALGGVWYDVPRTMSYRDPTQNLTINVKKGYQKLDGSLAMQVVRFRDGPNGYANGDLGRIETQQGFLKAVVEQCLQIGNITRINELAQVFTDNVTTNLSLNNIAWLAEKAVFGGLKMENVGFYTMPCKNGSAWSRSYGQNLSYVVPIVDELVTLVNECFNPYVDDLKSNELDIMYVNSNGTIASTTGTLEDTKANASRSSTGGSGGGSSSGGSSGAGSGNSGGSGSSGSPGAGGNSGQAQPGGEEVGSGETDEGNGTGGEETGETPGEIGGGQPDGEAGSTGETGEPPATTNPSTTEPPAGTPGSSDSSSGGDSTSSGAGNSGTTGSLTPAPEPPSSVEGAAA